MVYERVLAECAARGECELPAASAASASAAPGLTASGAGTANATAPASAGGCVLSARERAALETALLEEVAAKVAAEQVRDGAGRALRRGYGPV
jgi:hypothetical protein